MARIGVVIPVGPSEWHARWLGECLDSLAEQTRRADALVIVDDMHEISDAHLLQADNERVAGELEVWDAPWLLGVPHAFNAGLARAFDAGCDLVLMQGADDRLSPDALERAEAAYRKNGERDGYYWFDVHYSDGEEQRLPCNCAAVTPGLWRSTGGFPPESAIGACDSAYISMLMVHRPDALQHIDGGYIWHRRHEHQETARQGGLFGQREAMVDWFTRRWEAPQWGRDR